MVLNKNNRIFSDPEILDGIRCQDSAVLLFLYKFFYPRVQSFVLSNSGSEGDAEDLFQEILLFLFEKSRKRDLKLTGSLTSFLFVVMRNMWFNQLRRRKLEPRNGISDLESDSKVENDQVPALKELEQAEKENLFHTHFNRLGEECKEVLLLFIQGLSISEITTRMGYSSQQHTKNRRYRCKLSLFRRIKSDPRYKELYNGTGNNPDDKIPRW